MNIAFWFLLIVFLIMLWMFLSGIFKLIGLIAKRKKDKLLIHLGLKEKKKKERK